MKYLILLLAFFLTSCTKDFGQYEHIDKLISQPDSVKTILQTGNIRMYPEMDSLYFPRDNSVRMELFLKDLFKGFNGNYVDETPFLAKISVFKAKSEMQKKEFHQVRISSEDNIYHCSFEFIKENKQWYLHSIVNIITPTQYYDFKIDTTKK